MIKLGDNINVDLPKLIESRLLIQANSGGGKSYAIRKLLEETHGKVQQIVLDVEGEFNTLREKYDYILAGKDGDIPADPKSAELLAHKILELETSLIVDLYELKHTDRIRFVKNFVNAIVNSPKHLWHSVLIVIDEAHVFIPEKGHSEAAEAVIGLAQRGRKRGFACVLATQRLSNMSKDVAAQCLNKLIGRTSLDIDRKRAGEELGFLQKDTLQLRNLKSGEFFAFGPAISNGVISGKISQVNTTHPKAGQRLGLKKTKPTEHVKKILQKLTDLPAEAEAEAQDKESMQRKIKDLEGKLIQWARSAQSTPPPPKDNSLEIAEKCAKAYREGEITGEAHSRKVIKEMLAKVDDFIEGLRKTNTELNHKRLKDEEARVQAQCERTRKANQYLRERGITAPIPTNGNGHKVEPKFEVGPMERKILGFLNLYPGKFFTRAQVAVMSGYAQSGSFSNAISSLNVAGIITKEGTSIALKNDVNVSSMVDGTPHRLEDWIAKLGKMERAIYEFLLTTKEVQSKEKLQEVTGYSASGSFSNAVSRLNTLGLIKKENGGIRLNPDVANL